MKFRFLILLAVAGVLAACAKEETGTSESGNNGKVVAQFGAGISNVKTTLSPAENAKRKIFWAEGDCIAINGLASEPLTEETAGGVTAVFDFTSYYTTPGNVLYPSVMYKDENTITLPSSQAYVADGFASGAYPMAAHFESGSDATLSALCAMIKLPLKQASGTSPDTDRISTITFSGNAGEQVRGDFVIDYENATLTPASDAEEDKSFTMNVNKTPGTDPLPIVLIVPAGTYASGFSLKIMDVAGHYMVMSKETSFSVEAGHLYVMPEVEFIPTGTELGVEISSAADLIAFAQNYNSKAITPEGLIATLTEDIVFDETSSEAFNATGGIGMKTAAGDEEDYYFNGFFNGNDKTISGLQATVPLFTATGGAGKIQDLTVDGSCSFTFTHGNAAEAHFGSVVGYHKGSLKNVTVNADVTITAGDIAQVTALGGLVGRETEGLVQDCDYTGNITVPAGFQSSEKKIYIGGLVGYISNADGVVKNSAFEGTIDNQGQMIASTETDDFKSNPQLMIGGIIGLNSGTILNCTVANHVTGITVILTDDKGDHPYTGTVVTHSTNAYHYAIAGIAGRNNGTVQDCTNNATILNVFSAARGTGGNLNGRYLEVSGIVGYNASGKTVYGCTNNGAIINRANPKLHYVGGIVAWNYGIVSSCVNASSGTIAMGTSHTSPYGARMCCVGGVIGHNRASAEVSDIQNAANITVSRVENTTGVTHRIGGVVGLNDAVIDGESDGGVINNSGNVTQSNAVGMCATPTASNDYGYFLGGIVGYATNAVKNVSNSGNVTYTCSATGIGAQYVYLGGVIGKVLASSTIDIEKCTNTANVTFTASATYSVNPDTKYYYNYLGGIVGHAQNAAIKGECSNSGIIKGGDGSANNNLKAQSFTIGGIVGCLTGESSIENCALTGTGQVYNDHWSNRGIGSYDCPMDGGIAGLVIGEEGVPITITNCSVTSTKKAKETDPDGSTAIYARRGAVGGIVGMAKYAIISNCTVPVPFTGSGYFYGGIVAAAQNSEISSCTYSGTTVQSSQMQIGGGIIGQLDSGSTIDGCFSYATTVDKNGTAVATTGGIAGKSVVGTTISNSHYTASIVKICGEGEFTDGGGNVADL